MNILSRIRDIRPRVKYMMSRIRDYRPMSVNVIAGEEQMCNTQKENEFPCLKMEKMSDREKKVVKEQLHEEFRMIRNKFDDLVMSTQDELKSNRCNRTPQLLKETALFQDLACDLGDSIEIADDFDSIFTVLKKRCCFTWFHFEVLTDIIALCLPNGFQKYKEYVKYFNSYCERSLFHCPNLIGKYSKEYSNPLFVKVDDAVFKNSNINRYKKDFESLLVKIINIKQRDLVLLTYGEGCTQLVYGIRHSAAKRAFPLSQQQKELLSKIGVQKCYLCTDLESADVS